jgi:hypothetical protein
MRILLPSVIWHVCGYATSGNARCYMEYSEYHEYVIWVLGERSRLRGTAAGGYERRGRCAGAIRHDVYRHVRDAAPDLAGHPGGTKSELIAADIRRDVV